MRSSSVHVLFACVFVCMQLVFAWLHLSLLLFCVHNTTKYCNALVFGYGRPSKLFLHDNESHSSDAISSLSHSLSLSLTHTHTDSRPICVNNNVFVLCCGLKCWLRHICVDSILVRLWIFIALFVCTFKHFFFVFWIHFICFHFKLLSIFCSAMCHSHRRFSAGTSHFLPFSIWCPCVFIAIFNRNPLHHQFWLQSLISSSRFSATATPFSFSFSSSLLFYFPLLLIYSLFTVSSSSNNTIFICQTLFFCTHNKTSTIWRKLVKNINFLHSQHLLTFNVITFGHMIVLLSSRKLVEHWWCAAHTPLSCSFLFFFSFCWKDRRVCNIFSFK